MSSKEISRSEALRKAGNDLYSQVRDGCYGPCVLRLKLGKALKLYEEALKAAGHDKSERASTCKNLAAINWLWGKSEWQIYIQDSLGSSEALQAIRAAKERIPKSLKFYLLALELGESGAKPEIWATQVQETIVNNFFGWVKEQLDTYGVCFESIVVDLCAQMDNGGSSSQIPKVLASALYMIHVPFIFDEGLKYITEEDGREERRNEESGYKSFLNAMEKCCLELDKAEGIVYSTNNNCLIEQFQNLKEEVLLYINTNVVEPTEACRQGDGMPVSQNQIGQGQNTVRVEEKINVIKMEGEKSCESFLKFIYREHSHPDPKKGQMGKMDTPANVKAALRKAIQAYHPDSNTCFHQDWKILCEEITKILNCKYRAVK